MSNYENERRAAIAIATEAALEVHRIYNAQAAKTYTKKDESPVTDADLAADRIIRERLAELFPHDAVLTEEAADSEARLQSSRCWVVDPIDGTQQFINRTGQFDVLIALVVDGRPVVGVSAQPTTGLIASATAGGGAWLSRIGVEGEQPLVFAQPDSTPRIVTAIWFDPDAAQDRLRAVSAAMGIAEIAILPTGALVRDYLDPAANGLIPDSGEAPNSIPAHAMVGLWVREDRTLASEWDYAAPDLIVNEAGGRFTDWHGNEFRYNKPVPRNIGGLVIATNPDLHRQIVVALDGIVPN